MVNKIPDALNRQGRVKRSHRYVIEIEICILATIHRVKNMTCKKRGDASISEHRPSTLRSLLKRVDTQELDLFNDDFYI